MTENKPLDPKQIQELAECELARRKAIVLAHKSRQAMTPLERAEHDLRKTEQKAEILRRRLESTKSKAQRKAERERQPVLQGRGMAGIYNRLSRLERIVSDLCAQLGIPSP